VHSVNGILAVVCQMWFVKIEYILQLIIKEGIAWREYSARSGICDPALNVMGGIGRIKAE